MRRILAILPIVGLLVFGFGLTAQAHSFTGSGDCDNWYLQLDGTWNAYDITVDGTSIGLDQTVTIPDSSDATSRTFVVRWWKQGPDVERTVTVERTLDCEEETPTTTTLPEPTTTVPDGSTTSSIITTTSTQPEETTTTGQSSTTTTEDPTTSSTEPTTSTTNPAAPTTVDTEPGTSPDPTLPVTGTEQQSHLRDLFAVGCLVLLVGFVGVMEAGRE